MIRKQWFGNYHYESAIKRKDILFTAPIVLHTVLNFVQVLFAYNCVYFQGDKKLEEALSKLPYCPAVLLDNIEFLLCARSNVEILQKQYDILQTVRDEMSSKII